eukprot:7663121-Pyramimonas_sp.AAC.1
MSRSRRSRSSRGGSSNGSNRIRRISCWNGSGRGSQRWEDEKEKRMETKNPNQDVENKQLQR